VERNKLTHDTCCSPAYVSCRSSSHPYSSHSQNLSPPGPFEGFSCHWAHRYCLISKSLPNVIRGQPEYLQSDGWDLGDPTVWSQELHFVQVLYYLYSTCTISYAFSLCLACDSSYKLRSRALDAALIRTAESRRLLWTHQEIRSLVPWTNTS
jgi:hypothetical protein